MNSMPSYLSNVITTGVTMLILDITWLAVMGSTYNASYAKVQGKPIAIHFPSAVAAYSIMIIAFLIFVLPNIEDKRKNESCLSVAMKYGAPLGFVIYGVYNATNMAVFKQFEWITALMDTLWGTTLYFLTTLAVCWMQS